MELHFSVDPSNEYSGLISFRIDWFDLLTVQETLKSLLQHHNSKAYIYIYMRETDRKTERNRDRDFKELAYVIVGADRSKISRED